MAQKNLWLESPKIISVGNVQIFQDDVNSFISNQDFVDLVYIDPPYNTRQYAPNFHLLESIVVYDEQELKTKTGIRDYNTQKSKYCLKNDVCAEFEDLISKIKAKNIILSYSNEGLMSEQQIIDILSKKGEISVYRNPYRRFKTNAWTSDSTGLYELVFICKCFNA